MTEEEREEGKSGQEANAHKARVQRALESKGRELPSNLQGNAWEGVRNRSEQLHEDFYSIINESRDILTDEQENIVEGFKNWLSTIEEPFEITGV